MVTAAALGIAIAGFVPTAIKADLERIGQRADRFYTVAPLDPFEMPDLVAVMPPEPSRPSWPNAAISPRRAAPQTYPRPARAAFTRSAAPLRSMASMSARRDATALAAIFRSGRGCRVIAEGEVSEPGQVATAPRRPLFRPITSPGDQPRRSRFSPTRTAMVLYLARARRGDGASFGGRGPHPFPPHRDGDHHAAQIGI